MLYSAEKYAKRGMWNTDLLAFRCIEELKLLRNMDILDLGCGAGRSTLFLQELGNEVIGVDISSFMLRKAKQLSPGIEFIKMTDRVKIPCPSSSFDAIFSS